MTYTTIGPVRGTCGHQHQSLALAERCRRRDEQGCAAQGGYSDREVRRADGSRLDADERIRLLDLRDSA